MQTFCTILFKGKVIVKGSVIVGGRHVPEV